MDLVCVCPCTRFRYFSLVSCFNNNNDYGVTWVNDREWNAFSPLC